MQLKKMNSLGQKVNVATARPLEQNKKTAFWEAFSHLSPE